MSVLIRNVGLGTAPNLTNGLRATHDVLLDGKLHILKPGANVAASESIDGTGLWLLPAFTDCYGHIPDISGDLRGNIESETQAALAGGFSRIALAPDTQPCIDSAAMTQHILSRAQQSAHCTVLPIGALTQGLQGQVVTPVRGLLDAGCIAISQCTEAMADQQTLARAIRYASGFNATIIAVPFDTVLAGNGCAAEGGTALRMGLPPIPQVAETGALSSLVQIAAETGARIHFPIITTAESVRLVREAQSAGIGISAGTAMHYLCFDDRAIEGFNTLFRVIPPLRSAQDAEALLQGIKDGVLTTICSDHLPQESAAKKSPFPSAAPGISSYETVFSMGLSLVSEGKLSLRRLIECLTSGPAQALSLSQHDMEDGNNPDLVLIDPTARYTAGGDAWQSGARNTPLIGKTLQGKVLRVFCHAAGK